MIKQTTYQSSVAFAAFLRRTWQQKSRLLNLQVDQTIFSVCFGRPGEKVGKSGTP